MTPLLTGVFASQISGRLNTFTPTGSYDALATYTVPSGGVSQVTFNGIPDTYAHLQLRVSITPWGSGGSSDYLRINGDSGSNYTWHYLVGTGSGNAGAGAATSQTGMQNYFASPINNARIIDFLDYANTSKYKTMRSLVGGDNNGSGSIWSVSNLWLNTAAIKSLTFSIDGNNVPQHSTFSLYGVKG